MNYSLTLKTLGLVSALGTLSLVSTADAQRRPGRMVTANGRTTDASPARLRDQGTLSDRDRTDREGHHMTGRSVNLHAGDRVTFGVRSEDFDVIARVTSPRGQRWEDDDGAGGTNARLVFTAPTDGAYQFIVTSYEAGETGSFETEIDVRRGGGGAVDDNSDETDADESSDCDDNSCPNAGPGRRDDDDSEEDEARNDPADDSDDGDDGESEMPADPSAPDAPAAAPGGGRTFGIFVGITHYGGDNHDLPGASSDAVQLARAFQQAHWMTRQNAVVLTDAQATAANVRQAFQTMAQRVGPSDTLVFFFDGHGGSSILDTVGPDLSRRELGQMMDRVRGRQLLVLDSCEAGGFSPLVQRNAQRAGMFSSRADQSSSTAPEVGAGGWLAYFFRRAVEGQVRPAADGSLDFQGVRRYVAAQYQQRGVSRSQELVAVASDPRFTIGGRGEGTDPVVAAEPDVQVARRDTGRRPNRGARLPVQFPSGNRGGDEGGLFGSGDQFAQVLQMATSQFGRGMQQFVK